MICNLGKTGTRFTVNFTNVCHSILVFGRTFQALGKKKDARDTRDAFLESVYLCIGKNLADKVKPEKNHSFKDYSTDPINESLFVRPTDNNGVLKETNQLKNNATTDIRVSLLKRMKQKIVKGLVIIFNKSFKEGHFPELLKIAKVILIYKSADPKVKTEPTQVITDQFHYQAYSINN